MARTKQQRRRPWNVEEGSAGAWPGYSRARTKEEDKEGTNVHYEQPPEFFTTITGGTWKVYSCNLWDGATSVTDSQERKLDLLARLMDLQPGQRILDVGCGWAGPLIYLAKRYGVKGVGLTVSPVQKEDADRRIREHGAEVEVHECHWREFADADLFDVVFTDEVIVHFHDLQGFFEKVRKLLKPDGLMLNKELHFGSSKFLKFTRLGTFLSQIYGESGNYRMLHEDLALLDQTGFLLERIEQIPIANYQKTADGWLANMQCHRSRLEEMVGAEHYQRFRTYLRIVRKMHGSARPPMTLDVVAARSPA